ncbi:hypothetical protein [Pontibacter roseus]|uniref:hypothetical protein n=1 Tax=Pontibacter roseus TaxID=336989 RepID=UPI00036FAACD|nr:hypothetical protein [Pontibacter roseus]
MKKWPLYLVFPLLLAGCQSGPSEAEQQEALESEVMQLHDVAMADMGKIYRLRRSLTSLRDSLAQQSTDTATVNLLNQQITQLYKADEAMMSWMRQYKAPDTLAHEQAMLYLQEEHTKMAGVKALMDSTIANAKQSYSPYEQK